MSVLIYMFSNNLHPDIVVEGVSRFLGESSVHTQPNVCPVPPPYLRSYLVDHGSDVSNRLSP